MTALNDILVKEGHIPGIPGEPSDMDIYISNDGHSFIYTYALAAYWEDNMGIKITLAFEIDGGELGQGFRHFRTESAKDAAQIIGDILDNEYQAQELWGEYEPAEEEEED